MRLVAAHLPEAERMEQQEIPIARTGSHALLLISRAKATAIKKGVSRDEFKLRAGELIYFADIQARLTANFAASGALPQVTAAGLATLSLGEAIRQGVLPSLMYTADDRMARDRTDVGGALHRTLHYLAGQTLLTAGLARAGDLADIGSNAEVVDNMIETVLAGKIEPEAVRYPENLEVRQGKLRKGLDPGSRPVLRAAPTTGAAEARSGGQRGV